MRCPEFYLPIEPPAAVFLFDAPTCFRKLGSLYRYCMMSNVRTKRSVFVLLGVQTLIATNRESFESAPVTSSASCPVLGRVSTGADRVSAVFATTRERVGGADRVSTSFAGRVSAVFAGRGAAGFAGRASAAGRATCFGGWTSANRLGATTTGATGAVRVLMIGRPTFTNLGSMTEGLCK